MINTRNYFRTNSGDVLAVEWTGSVWRAPSSGAEHAHASDAMRCEVRQFLAASGDDTDDHLDLWKHGVWLDPESEKVWPPIRTKEECA